MSFSTMVGTLDLETRGLAGPIIVGAIHLGEARPLWRADLEYRTAFFEDAQVFKAVLAMIQPRILYIHNLEFDLRKLLKHWGIRVDWRGGHLVVGGKVVKIQLKDFDIELRDTCALLPGRLRELVRDFGIGTKGDLPDTDTISPDDPMMLEYLRGDVTLLYKLVERVYELSGLTFCDWLKAATTAGLAMRVFDKVEENHAGRYLRGSSTILSYKADCVLRTAYLGGRCEVFRLSVGEAWHYDCNSLYPAVMKDADFPVDAPRQSDTPVDDFNRYLASGQGFGIARAEVTSPFAIDPPLLGIRNAEGRHLYPTGTFCGWWTFVELAKAVEVGYSVRVKEAWVSRQGAAIFRRFVGEWEQVKVGSAGAQREFAKLMLNGLAGKFGQNRTILSYAEYGGSEVVYHKAVAAGSFVADTELLGSRLIVTEKEARGYFLRVDIAIHIVALARIKLYEAMVKVKRLGGLVAYCDTDSMVSTVPLPPAMVDRHKFGHWKLLRHIRAGVYLAPKFYAEREYNDSETMKARGVAGEFRRSLSYEQFQDWLLLVKGGKNEIQLYGKGDGVSSFPGLLTALKRGWDLDAMIERSYTLRFAHDRRRFDLTSGESVPVHLG